MKKAIITGANGGIGSEVARLLAAKNYSITLVGRNEKSLNDLLNDLHGSGHTSVVADLTKTEDVETVSFLIRKFKYDLLINNAGAGNYGRFTELPLADQLENMQLNMQALVTLSYHFLQQATKGDALVNIGSLLAHTSLPGASVYAATKSFVANFSESLWLEYQAAGIFVTGFNPGAADSAFHVHAGKQASDFPEFVVSKTRDVAAELVAALEKRNKPRVVQGWKNRFMLFGFRWLSRKTAVQIMGKISPGLKN